MSATIAALAASYGSGSKSDSSSEGSPCLLPAADSLMHLTKSPLTKSSLAVAVASAPEEDLETGVHLDPAYNPTYDTMFALELGPENSFRTQQMTAPRNVLSGYAEPVHINDFMFEQQRRTFVTYDYALDPSLDNHQVSAKYIGSVEEAERNQGLTVFETGQKKTKKRKKFKENDAKYVDEKVVAKPSEEEQKELDEITAKRQKKGKEKQKPLEEKTTLQVKDILLYHLKNVIFPKNKFMYCFPFLAIYCCLVPWTVKLSYGRFMETGAIYEHLLVTVKLLGIQFLSAAYDRYLKLWDTETGQCTNRKVPYCVKFNPDEDKQNFFVAGMSHKNIVQWDIRSGEIVQECDRHLGAVNTIVFVDENRRSVSTSDDKSLRVWERDIPVDFKFKAEPSMHSMPAVTLSPNGKWLASGYACQVGFSPDMSCVISGDGNGKLNIWDWNTTKLYSRFKAHDEVWGWGFSSTSKVITCGWDGVIKLWD
uniref:Uncharacterized protein n=1 Tax=Cavia porcellus TaxID=10141 RepID=A0A286X8C7_CAVPO